MNVYHCSSYMTSIDSSSHPSAERGNFCFYLYFIKCSVSFSHCQILNLFFWQIYLSFFLWWLRIGFFSIFFSTFIHNFFATKCPNSFQQPFFFNIWKIWYFHNTFPPNVEEIVWIWLYESGKWGIQNYICLYLSLY